MLCGLVKPNCDTREGRRANLLDEILATPHALIDTPTEDELRGRYLSLQGKVQDVKVDW